MTISPWSNLFSCNASTFGILKRLTKSRKSEHVAVQQPYADESPLRQVAPSVVDSRSVTSEHRPHLLCNEGDDWPRVEELQAVPENVHVGKLEHVTTQPLLDEEISLSTAPTENAYDHPSVSSNQDTEDSEGDEDTDSESEEEELVPGTLQMPPSRGSRVKVLYDDDEWHEAEVLEVEGSKAKLEFQDGRRSMLDFDVYAIRLADYESEDEGSDVSGDESVSEDESLYDEPSAQLAVRKDVGDVEEISDDDHEDEVEIRGTLAEAPEIGTLVQILLDDDGWHPARIIKSNGTRATVLFEDNDEDEVDFNEHAVRLLDYESDNEDNENNDEDSDVEDDTCANNCEAVECSVEQVSHMEMATEELKAASTGGLESDAGEAVDEAITEESGVTQVAADATVEAIPLDTVHAGVTEEAADATVEDMVEEVF